MDDPALGVASTGAVVDMDVFGQLLEIVSRPIHVLVRLVRRCEVPGGWDSLPSQLSSDRHLSQAVNRNDMVHFMLARWLTMLQRCLQDDDDTHEFSKMLAFDYITQAESTFEEIEKDLYAINTTHFVHSLPPLC